MPEDARVCEKEPAVACGEQLAKMTAFLAVGREVSQLLLRVKTEKELFERLCATLLGLEFIALAWIGVVEEGTQQVIPVAQAGAAEGYLANVVIAWDDSAYGNGPTGRAIKTQQPQLSGQIGSDINYTIWSEQALAQGFACSAAIPLVYKGEAIGALNVYSNRAGAFDEMAMAFFCGIGADIAMGLKGLRAEMALRQREEQFRSMAEALAESEEMLRLFMEYNPIYVFFKDEQIRPLQLSKNFEQLVGRPVSDLLGKRMEDLFPAPLAAAMIEDDKRVLREGKMIEVVEEFGGRIYTTTKFPIVREGKGPLVAGFTIDITDRERQRAALIAARQELEKTNCRLQAANAELNRRASMDQLTGAWNRWRFHQTIGAEMERARRYQYPLAILSLDIDHFKKINDTCGHEIGDRVLVELVDLIQRHIRQNDFLARWGGEEFMLLAPHLTPEQVLDMGGKIRSLVEGHVFSPAIGTVTVSIGTANWQEGEKLDCWIKRADDALYAAKLAGRNRICCR